MVRSCGEKDRARCSDENMEDGSGWTPKGRKTITEVQRCYTKKYEGKGGTEKKHTSGEHGV